MIFGRRLLDRGAEHRMPDLMPDGHVSYKPRFGHAERLDLQHVKQHPAWLKTRYFQSRMPASTSLRYRLRKAVPSYDRAGRLAAMLVFHADQGEACRGVAWMEREAWG